MPNSLNCSGLRPPGLRPSPGPDRRTDRDSGRTALRGGRGGPAAHVCRRDRTAPANRLPWQTRRSGFHGGRRAMAIKARAGSGAFPSSWSLGADPLKKTCPHRRRPTGAHSSGGIPFFRGETSRVRSRLARLVNGSYCCPEATTYPRSSPFRFSAVWWLRENGVSSPGWMPNSWIRWAIWAGVVTNSIPSAGSTEASPAGVRAAETPSASPSSRVRYRRSSPRWPPRRS